MLQHMQSIYAQPAAPRMAAVDAYATIDAGEALSILRRHLGLLLVTSLLAIGAAYAYTESAGERYVATTQILIDPRDLQMLEREVNPRALSTDSGVTVVESQARVLGSDSVLLKAIATLQLTTDPEFSGAQAPLPNTVLGKVRGLFRRPAAATGDATLNALSVLKRNLLIKRGERSFVVDVVTYADNPLKAAKIANAVAQAYLTEQGETRSDSARQAGTAIEGRLADLKRRVGEDEARINKYRNDKNLVVSGGRYINEQQLTELANQLNAAQADTARARSRFEEIETSKGSPENLPEAVRSETLRVLRAQHANVVRERARLATQFKPAHPRMADITNQEAQSQRLIIEEIRRITESAKLDYRRAQAGEQSLRTTLESARKQMNETSSALVELRELERALEASRSVYQASLVRAREASVQSELNTTNARIISIATPSLDKLWPPRKSLLLPLTLLGGLGAGSALAFVLEAARRRRHNFDRAQNGGADTIRPMPAERLPDPHRVAIPGSASDLAVMAAAKSGTLRTRTAADIVAFADLRGAPRTPGGSLAPASLAMAIIDNPSSPVSRQLNQLYLALRRLERDDQPRSVLIVPDRQSPMKSEVALGLAVAGGMTGDRILLIDADASNRTLSEALCPEAKFGLGDVLSGRVRLADAVVTYPETSIEILVSTAAQASPPRPDASTFSALLDAAGSYDLVIIDGAPLGHRIASLATAASVSDILFVVGSQGASGSESSEMLGTTMRATPKFRGIVLTD